MRFNDHMRGYSRGAEGFDQAAASARLTILIKCMMALRYGRGFMTAVKDVCHEVRRICRQSEQAQRYKWKLRMLRHKAWREAVFEQLGGDHMLARWDNQPPLSKLLSEKAVRIAPRLFDWQLAQREHIKLCAKACAHPRIFKDPCKLDQEGLFRLPPIRKAINPALRHPNVILHDYHYDARPVYKRPHLSSPITVWPDEFRAFEGYEEGVEDWCINAVKARPKPKFTHPILMIFGPPLSKPRKQSPIFVPP